MRVGPACASLPPTMPRILITTEPLDTPDAAVMLSERVATSDLTSEHFANQLIQRIRWALADAEKDERQVGYPEPAKDAALAETLLNGS
jgi:hypothetical protein